MFSIDDLKKYIKEATGFNDNDSIATAIAGGKLIKAGPSTVTENDNDTSPGFARLEKPMFQEGDRDPNAELVDILAGRIARGEGRVWDGTKDSQGHALGFRAYDDHGRSIPTPNVNTEGLNALLAAQQQKIDRQYKEGSIDALEGKNEADMLAAQAARDKSSLQPKDIYDIEQKAQSRIQDSRAYQALSAVDALLPGLEKSIDIDSAVADLDFKTAIPKVYDAIGVIRDSDGRIVAGASGVPDQLLGYLNTLSGGGGIPRNAKRALFNFAVQRRQGLMDELQKFADPTIRLTETYGGKRSRFEPPQLTQRSPYAPKQYSPEDEERIQAAMAKMGRG